MEIADMAQDAMIAGSFLKNSRIIFKGAQVSSSYLMAKAKAVGIGRLATGAFTLNQFVDEFAENRNSGYSTASAALKAAGSAATDLMLFSAYPVAYPISSFLSPFVEMGVKKAWNTFSPKGLRRVGRDMKQASQAFSNVQFNDNEQIATMRQAGMSIAARSQYSVQRAMLGHEATYMAK